MKYIPLLCSILMSGLLIAKRPLPGKESGILSIGAVLPLTGSQASYGQEALTAIKIGLEDLKQRYPKVASKIRLHVADDHSISQRTLSAIGSLKSKRPSIYLGAIAWPAAQVLAKFAYERKKPLVVPTVPASLFRAQRPYVFSASLAQEAQGKALSSFLLGTLMGKRAALMVGSEDIYGRLIGESFADSYLNRGGVLSQSIRFGGSSADGRDILKKVRDSSPDAIVFPSGSAAEIRSFLGRARSLGIKAPFVGGEAWDKNSLLKALINEPEKNYFVTGYSALDTSYIVRNFEKSFIKRSNRRAGIVAAMYYDSVLFIGEAFARAQSVDSGRLIEALSDSKQVPGLHGLMMSNNQVFERTMVVLEVGQGHKKFLKVMQPSSQKPGELSQRK